MKYVLRLTPHAGVANLETVRMLLEELGQALVLHYKRRALFSDKMAKAWNEKSNFYNQATVEFNAHVLELKLSIPLLSDIDLPSL